MKSFVVTGGNKGIGLAIVRRILVEIDDSFVFLCSRSIERGQAAIDGLVQENGNFSKRLNLIQYDAGSETSVLQAAETIKDFLSVNPDRAPLEGLVNNAGIGGDEYSLKEVLDVNLFAVNTFTNSLLPAMNKTGRLVHISSGSAPNFVTKCNQTGKDFFRNPNVTWENLADLISNISADIESGTQTHLNEFGLDKESFQNYGFSKALLNSLTMMQARENPSMTINACTPGWIITDMTLRYAENDIEKAKAMGMKTPEEGANSTLFLLTSTELKGNGWFYGSDCRRSPLHKYRSPGSPEYDGSED